MKKILIFSLVYDPYVGGAEIAVKEITNRVPPNEVSFDMVCLRLNSILPRVEKIGNVTVHRVGFSKKNPTAKELVSFPMYLAKVLFPLSAFLKAISLHAKNGYDGVWAIMSYAGFPVVFFKTVFRKMPFILTLQEGDTVERITKRLRIRAVGFVHRAVFRKADIIQVISTFLGGWARDMGYKGPIEVIPNGVDVSLFDKEYSKEELKDIEKKIRPRAADRVVITTSRLVPKNGVDTVIESLAFLPSEVKFVVLGTGPDEASLKKLAKEKGVSDRVLFLGHVDYAEIPKYLKASDVFARPSRSEGMGNSFIEAMAAGIPVVATPVGGIVDFLRDAEDEHIRHPTGFVARPDNPKHLAEKIRTALTNGALREKAVAHAREMVREKYDWNIVARMMRTRVFGKIPSRQDGAHSL